MSLPPDPIEFYNHQEASGLRRQGWLVVPPARLRDWCIGVDGEGCPVRTPFGRCRYCLRTLRLRRAA